LKSFFQFLGRAYKYFRGTKRVWRKPPRADLLIIDRGTASPLDEMFAHHNPHIMDIRGESVNMLALLRAVPKIHLGAVAYLEAYIDFVKPKLILSHTDFNVTLWNLKRRNVNYRVAIVQCAWRPELFGELAVVAKDKHLNTRCGVDMAFAYGPRTVSLRIGEVADSVSYCGSTKANLFPCEVSEKKTNVIAILAQFRTKMLEIDPDFYLPEREVFRTIGELAKNNQLRVFVYSPFSTDQKNFVEKEVLDEYFQGFSFEYLPLSQKLDSYHGVKNAELVISIDSTLGYEALGLGSKVCIFTSRTLRSDYEPFYSLLKQRWGIVGDLGVEAFRVNNKFGSQADFGDHGFFWSNVRSRDEIIRVFNSVLNATRDEWERVSRPFADQLMVHDYGNTKIRAYVEGVLTGSLKSN
jgi:surface carbohydrate biosynthesis protein